jgi:Mg2+ and Co2+ transporter CorA
LLNPVAINKEISEDTVVGLSLKTVGMIIGGAVIVSLGYFDLKAEVKEAKELPVPVIGRTEYDLKDELIRSTIMNTKSDVDDIKKQLDKIEERLFEMK